MQACQTELYMSMPCAREDVKKGEKKSQLITLKINHEILLHT